MAYALAITTVFFERVVQPAALLIIGYLEQTLAPADAQPQLVLVPATPVTVTEAVTPVKPRAARRRRATKTKLAAED
ncbi:hypothetical protein SynBIOSE41_02440 [Synechococcus sp. BIOS-E4-1]|nr:hypothetical protein SynBIOSE41_02440 [Synechococcus sp. BIOS-E4-1]